MAGTGRAAPAWAPVLVLLCACLGAQLAAAKITATEIRCEGGGAAWRGPDPRCPAPLKYWASCSCATPAHRAPRPPPAGAWAQEG